MLNCLHILRERKGERRERGDRGEPTRCEKKQRVVAQLAVGNDSIDFLYTVRPNSCFASLQRRVAPFMPSKERTLDNTVLSEEHSTKNGIGAEGV